MSISRKYFKDKRQDKENTKKTLTIMIATQTPTTTGWVWFHPAIKREQHHPMDHFKGKMKIAHLSE